MLASSGYVSCVNEEKCIGCGICAETCQFAALTIKDGYVEINEAVCMGCGGCVSKCPENALSLVRDPTKSVPLDVEELLRSRNGPPVLEERFT
jgi:heterodisulfide reductase subunit A-like polyferredoxin